MQTPRTDATQHPTCAAKAGQIVPMLVWSGLGFCAVAATLYDLREIVGW